MATHALDAVRAALEQDKRQIALWYQTLFVHRTSVHVTMAMQQQAQHVLPLVLRFVRLVPMDITKMATHALHALCAALVHELDRMKQELVLRY